MPDGMASLLPSRQFFGQTLRLGDCLSIMKGMQAESVDVIVTSPPYNLNLSYSQYDDARDEQEYLVWMEEIFTELMRVAKSNASIFLNISGSNVKPYIPFELLTRLRRVGFHLQNHISWVKSIGMGTESRGHFKPVGGKRFMHNNHEHIFHLTLNNNVELDRLSIGIPFQDKTNILRRGHDRDLRCRGNTWFIPYSTVKSKVQKFNHPGTFPVELPLWCIYLHGKSDSLVLDPFVGTGTTLVAARLAGVNGIGIDVDPAYIKTARERVQHIGEGALDIVLNRTEIQELLIQNPATEKDGGWQSLVVGLQKRTNKTTGHLTLTASDIEQIHRYAFGYTKGGWQARLKTIFERHLGPQLDGSTSP